MKKKLLSIIFITIFVLIIGCAKVEAASASISATSTNAKVGDKVSVKVNFTAAAWNLRVSGSGISGKSYASQTSDLSEGKTSDEFVLNTSKAGTYTISLKGDITDKNGNTQDISKTVTIKVTKKEQKPQTEGSDSIATLKNLGISPNDFKGFKSNITTYNIEVPNATDKIKIYAEAMSLNAKVSGTGSKTLKVGKNTYNVKVTAGDKKITKTYTLNITRKDGNEQEETSDATLKNLGITPNDFSGFKATTTTYSVKVPNDVSTITIYATPNNSNAEVTGKGLKDLEIGINTFSVKVTAEDKKTTKTYTLKITREKEEEKTEQENNDDKKEENNIIGLTNIQVEGLELTPSFSNDIYEYNVTASSDTKTLNIKTEKSSDDISIDIVGNEELKLGENVITLLVYNSKKDETTTYQIVATLENPKVDLTEVNDSMSKVQRELIAKKIIIIGTLVVIVMLIIVFVVQRNKILSKNEFLENDDKEGRIDLSKDESMFERINENTEIVKKKTGKKKGNHFK